MPSDFCFETFFFMFFLFISAFFLFMFFMCMLCVASPQGSRQNGQARGQGGPIATLSGGGASRRGSDR